MRYRVSREFSGLSTCNIASIGGKALFQSCRFVCRKRLFAAVLCTSSVSHCVYIGEHANQSSVSSSSMMSWTLVLARKFRLTPDCKFVEMTLTLIRLDLLKLSSVQLSVKSLH